MTLKTIITAESHWDSERVGTQDTQDRLWEEGWLKQRQENQEGGNPTAVSQQLHGTVEPDFPKGHTMKEQAEKFTNCNNFIFIFFYLRKKLLTISTVKDRSRSSREDVEASSLESLRTWQSEGPVGSNFEVSLALKMEDVWNNSKSPFQTNFSCDFVKWWA